MQNVSETVKIPFILLSIGRIILKFANSNTFLKLSDIIIFFLCCKDINSVGERDYIYVHCTYKLPVDKRSLTSGGTMAN